MRADIYIERAEHSVNSLTDELIVFPNPTFTDTKLTDTQTMSLCQFSCPDKEASR